MLISEGAKRLNLRIVENGSGEYDLIELFTTQDGSWEVSNKPFSLPAWAMKHLPGFTSAGAATHALVRVEDANGQPITIGVTFGNVTLSTANKPEKWAVQEVHGSYKPDRGEHGAMTINFPGAKQRIEGVGLPLNNHVSLFAVYRKTKQVTPPVVTPPVVNPPTQIGSISVPLDLIIDIEQEYRKLGKLIDGLRKG